MHDHGGVGGGVGGGGRSLQMEPDVTQTGAAGLWWCWPVNRDWIHVEGMRRL